MTLITIAESVKQEIAERVVEQSHPVYSKEYMGEWYVVNGSALLHKERHASWSLWSDDDAVISVEDLIFEIGGADDEHAIFDAGDYDDEDAVEAAVSFALGYVPDSYDAAAWESRLADERGY